VNLQKHIVRALMLEYSYREHPELIRAGISYTEAPWWLLEGALQIMARRDTGLDTDLFKRIVDVNRLPPIGKFLAGAPHDFDGTAVESMDQACAMCLVQLLEEQPGGHASLANLLRHWPESNDNPVGSLLRDFPGLGNTEQSLQKWWTLNLARFSAADRFKGLGIAETESNLAKILQLEIAADDGSSKTTYALSDFPKFIKLKASKEVLASTQSALVALAVRGSTLHGPIISDYAEIVGLIARGKTHGLKDRIAKLDQLRADVHQRVGAIADYLNWFEATQMDVRSGKFGGYLKIASELDRPPVHHDPLSTFLDETENAMEANPVPPAANSSPNLKKERSSRP